LEEKAVLIKPLAACRKEGRGKLMGEEGVSCTACNLLVEGVLGGVALLSRSPGMTPEEGPIKGLVRIPVKYVHWSVVGGEGKERGRHSGGMSRRALDIPL
jgi:hypothetical protein